VPDQLSLEFCPKRASINRIALDGPRCVSVRLMRIWSAIALIGLCGIVAFWIARPVKDASSITIQCRGKGWTSVTGPRDGITKWNRAVYLKNDGKHECAGEVYCFVGRKPDAAWFQNACAAASRGIDLTPGEAVSTGVWISEKPVGKISAVVFLSSASDRRDRIAFRTRYPFLKAFRPLPYIIVEMPE
jgi:hypothetical protein